MRSARRRESHIASFAAQHEAMYSASQVEVAAQVCFFERQLIAPPAAKNIEPLVDFPDSLQPPQSASENPWIPRGLVPSYRMPNVRVELVYRRSRFKAIQSFSHGFSQRCDNFPIANAISGLELTIRYIKLPIACL